MAELCRKLNYYAVFHSHRGVYAKKTSRESSQNGDYAYENTVFAFLGRELVRASPEIQPPKPVPDFLRFHFRAIAGIGGVLGAAVRVAHHRLPDHCDIPLVCHPA